MCGIMFLDAIEHHYALLVTDRASNRVVIIIFKDTLLNPLPLF